MRAVIALLAIGIIAMGALVGVNAALGDNERTTSVTEESWTPDPGNVTTLNKSNIDAATYNESVEVYDSNMNPVKAGDDYVWFEENGTVQAVEGGTLDGEPEAFITYSYTSPPVEQLRMANLMSLIPNSAGVLLPVIGFMFLLLLLKP